MKHLKLSAEKSQIKKNAETKASKKNFAIIKAHFVNYFVFFVKHLIFLYIFICGWATLICFTQRHINK